MSELNNILSSFESKFSSIKNKEDLQNYRRFIPILNNNFVFNIENMINIFVISCHYSVRYKNSESSRNSRESGGLIKRNHFR